MVSVCVKQFLSAIDEAEVFSLPDMSTGMEYIYNNLYKQLLNGEGLRLSAIDWDRFELEDVDSMRDMYSDVLEAHEAKADSLVQTLRNIQPAVVAAAFV